MVNVQGQSDTVVRAWEILRENGLPRERVKGLDDVFASTAHLARSGPDSAPDPSSSVSTPTPQH